jgi:hypothetical protein
MEKPAEPTTVARKERSDFLMVKRSFRRQGSARFDEDWAVRKRSYSQRSVDLEAGGQSFLGIYEGTTRALICSHGPSIMNTILMTALS